VTYPLKNLTKVGDGSQPLTFDSFLSESAGSSSFLQMLAMLLELAVIMQPKTLDPLAWPGLKLWECLSNDPPCMSHLVLGTLAVLIG
jgi:hypothetical protein